MAKTLVVYFSASGTTAKIADKIAAALGADIHEIVPEIKYTRADLNWMLPRSRSSLEMKDKSCRPNIVDRVENMAQYDTILLGFPIWWYTAPRIVNSFLEQYDLSGKTIIPFATSGSSGMGDTNQVLAPSCPGAMLKDGKRFSGRAKESDIHAWLESLELN